MVKWTISRYCPFKPCETTSWSTVSIFASVHNKIYKQWTKHWCVFVFTETADWKGVNNCCDLCPTRAQQEEMARGALPPFCSLFPAFFFIFHQAAASVSAFFRPLSLCPILLLPALTWPFLVSYPQTREKIDWRLCCIHSQLSGRQHRVYRVPCPVVGIRSPHPLTRKFSLWAQKRDYNSIKNYFIYSDKLFTRQELWSRTHSFAVGVPNSDGGRDTLVFCVYYKPFTIASLESKGQGSLLIPFLNRNLFCQPKFWSFSSCTIYSDHSWPSLTP